MSAIVAAAERPPGAGLPAAARTYLFRTLAFAGALAVATAWTHPGHVRWFDLAGEKAERHISPRFRSARSASLWP